MTHFMCICVCLHVYYRHCIICILSRSQEIVRGTHWRLWSYIAWVWIQNLQFPNYVILGKLLFLFIFSFPIWRKSKYLPHGVLWELSDLVFAKYLEHHDIAWHIINTNKHWLLNKSHPTASMSGMHKFYVFNIPCFSVYIWLVHAIQPDHQIYLPLKKLGLLLIAVRENHPMGNCEHLSKNVRKHLLQDLCFNKVIF